ncbi:MAG: GspH/FimT family pseudopilin [Candidatus Aminicenantales bacterium]
MKKSWLQEGFTTIEMIAVVGILGILLVASYPAILNTLETRGLENEARKLLTTLQQTKFQAVKQKLNYRIRLDNSQGYWIYLVERQVNSTTWTEVQKSVRKMIPPKYTVTVNVPNQMVVFSPLGMVLNYNPAQHTIAIQSPTLLAKGQPSTRSVIIYAGGSIQYLKST